MGAAFEGQQLDFEYYSTKATGKVKELRETAQAYAESIKTGEYQHTNVDIDVKMNAPVVIIPENIFDPDAVQLVLDTGNIYVSSNLLEFQK